MTSEDRLCLKREIRAPFGSTKIDLGSPRARKLTVKIQRKSWFGVDGRELRV